MITVKNLKYNGNSVSGVKFNTNEVLIYNLDDYQIKFEPVEKRDLEKFEFAQVRVDYRGYVGDEINELTVLPTEAAEEVKSLTTYESSTPDIKVTEDGHLILGLLKVDAGTIKAIFPGNDIYKPILNSYIIYYTPAEPRHYWIYNGSLVKKHTTTASNPTFPTVYNPYNVEIFYMYESELDPNNIIASINHNTGFITLTGNIGSCMVYARCESNGYYSNMAVYTLTVESELRDSQISWMYDSEEIYFSDQAILNTLLNPNNLTVSYSSYNPDIAEIDNSGKITLQGQNGTCTIKAQWEQLAINNIRYRYGSAIFTLKVNLPEESGLYFIGYDSEKLNPQNNGYIACSGGLIAAIIGKGVDKGPYTVNNGSVESTYIKRIDDYALMFYAPILWLGGGGASRYGVTANFTVNSNSEKSKEFDILARIDEDNNILLSGEFTNKVIRVPHTGKTFNTHVWKYSRMWEDLSLWTYDWYNGNITEFKENSIVSSISLTKISALDTILSVTVSENTKNSYREQFICISSNSRYQNPSGNNSVGIHIIQEPYSDRRIYYKTDPYNYSEYIDIVNISYDSIFSLASSKVLEDNDSILVNFNNGIYVPMSIFYIYDIKYDEDSISKYVSDTIITWGNLEYVRIDVPDNSFKTVTFNLR